MRGLPRQVKGARLEGLVSKEFTCSNHVPRTMTNSMRANLWFPNVNLTCSVMDIYSARLNFVNKDELDQESAPG